MVRVCFSAWSPGQVLANQFCFSFVLQVSELEKNFNTNIRYQNWTEQEVMPTLEYRFNSSDYEF